MSGLREMLARCPLVDRDVPFEGVLDMVRVALLAKMPNGESVDGYLSSHMGGDVVTVRDSGDAVHYHVDAAGCDWPDDHAEAARRAVEPWMRWEGGVIGSAQVTSDADLLALLLRYVQARAAVDAALGAVCGRRT